MGDGFLLKMPVDGGEPKRVCPVVDRGSVRGASWGDDGTIVFAMGKSLYRVSPKEGPPRSSRRRNRGSGTGGLRCFPEAAQQQGSGHP